MSTENNKPKIEELKAKAKNANSIAKRRKIIDAFYELLRNGKEVKVFNNDLQKDISINKQSVNETKYHAAKSTASTKAVLELINVLGNAKKVKEVAVKENTKKQQDFQKMIVLTDYIAGIGEVKLTVGVTKTEGKHIQYCLTAIK